MEKLAALLAWADENNVRLVFKFIPDQKPSVFVVEAQVPFKHHKRKHTFEFVRKRGKTVEEVCRAFLVHVR